MRRPSARGLLAARPVAVGCLAVALLGLTVPVSADAISSATPRAAPATDHDINLIGNGGFESEGNTAPLVPWSCEIPDPPPPPPPPPGNEFWLYFPVDEDVPREPPPPGNPLMQARPAAANAAPRTADRTPDFGTRNLTRLPSPTAKSGCTQTVPVRPNASYTLSAWARGGYVFLGTQYGQTWANPGPTWTRLTTSFVTGPDVATVTVHVHGWYGGERFTVDNVELIGPDSTVRAPAVPQGARAMEETSQSVRLGWSAVPGAAAYRVYRNGTLTHTTNKTFVRLRGLTPGSTHRFSVSAVNSAGESDRSDFPAVSMRPAAASPPSAPSGLAHAPLSDQLRLSWRGVLGTTDGYYIYRDGVRVGWLFGTRGWMPKPAPGTYRFEVTAVNSAGESPKSSPLMVTVPAG